MCRLANSMGITLEESAKYICPINKTMSEKIEKLRDFAKNRAISASINEYAEKSFYENISKKRRIVSNIE